MDPIETPPPPLEPGEAALAVIGISAVIDGTVPRITKPKLAEIANLKDVINDLAEKLTRGSLSLKPIPRRHSYSQLLDRLNRKMTTEETHELVNKFPAEASDVSGPFIVAVNDAMQRLKSIFPTSEYVTFVGPKTMTPPDDKVFEFFNELLVINDPLVVFRLMSSAALLPEQAQVVQSFFPSLSANVKAAIKTQITARKTDRPNYQLPFMVETGFATWLGKRTVDYNPQPAPPQKAGNPAAASKIANLSEGPSPQSR